MCHSNRPRSQAQDPARDPELVALEEVIAQINDLFSGDHPDSSVRNVVNHIKDRLEESDTLQEQAQNNSLAQFSASPDLQNEFVSAVSEPWRPPRDLSTQILNNPELSQKLLRRAGSDHLPRVAADSVSNLRCHLSEVAWALIMVPTSTRACRGPHAHQGLPKGRENRAKSRSKSTMNQWDRSSKVITPTSVTIMARNAKSSNLSGSPCSVTVIVPVFGSGVGSLTMVCYLAARPMAGHVRSRLAVATCSTRHTQGHSLPTQEPSQSSRRSPPFSCRWRFGPRTSFE